VLHLMIAGRLHWRPPRGRIPGKLGIAALDFPPAAPRDRGRDTQAGVAPLDPGADALAALDPAGWRSSRRTCRASARPDARESHPEARAHRSRLLAGIGNAYSDEILHRPASRPSN